jgi:hypothetical protein
LQLFELQLLSLRTMECSKPLDAGSPLLETINCHLANCGRLY